VSYLLITLFMTLHVVGAHYTYAQVPVGEWIKQALGLDRNCFDRVAHFCFGLLMTYPLREVLCRALKGHRGWAGFFALSTVLAFSGAWEILESWLAQIVSPGSGAAYLGAQGDLWDAQNDMAAALYGSAVCLGLILLRRLFTQETLPAEAGPVLESSRLT
jgi:putative membrane protein